MSFGSIEQAAEVIKHTSHTGIVGPTISFAVGTIGAGVLAIPTAFRDAGIYVALLVIVASGLFTILGVNYMAQCIESTQENSYEDLSIALLGKKSMALAQIILVAITIGMVIAYMVVIGDVLEPFLPSFAYFTGRSDIFLGANGRTYATGLYWCAVVLPILAIPRVKYLNFTSSLGVFASLYVTFLVVYRYFVPFEYGGQQFSTAVPPALSPAQHDHAMRYNQAMHDHHLHSRDHLQHFHAHPLEYVYWGFSLGALVAFPIMMFAFDSLPIVFQLFSIIEGESNKLWQMTKIGIANSAICGIVFTCIGLFGYLSFGSNVQDNILSNYDPRHDTLAAIAYISCCFTITMAYAVNLFPARDVILNHFFGLQQTSLPSKRSRDYIEVQGRAEMDPRSSSGSRSSNRSDNFDSTHIPYYLHLTTVVLLSIFCFVVSYIVPSIVVVISMCGSLGSSLLCYVYPAAYVLQMHARGIRRCNSAWELPLAWVMLVVGIVSGVLGTWISIYAAINPMAVEAAAAAKNS